jgi:hypothetical protein
MFLDRHTALAEDGAHSETDRLAFGGQLAGANERYLDADAV